MLLAILKDAVETGLPYSLAYIGVWMVFRLQDDFDLTCGGSFALGGAVSATWLSSHASPWVALGLGALFAAAAGAITFAAMRILGLTLILASIVVNLALYSVNLRVMSAPQVQIAGETIFSQWQASTRFQDTQIGNMAIGAIIISIVVFALSYFLKSEAGLALRASGLNQKMVRSIGVSPVVALFATLTVSNGLVGFSGGLVAQQQGFSDVNMGLNTIIVGVTAILLGELFLAGRGVVIGGVVAVVFGTILYRALIAWVLRMGIDPLYFNAITAAAVFASVAIRRGVVFGGVAGAGLRDRRAYVEETRRATAS